MSKALIGANNLNYLNCIIVIISIIIEIIITNNAILISIMLFIQYYQY